MRLPRGFADDVRQQSDIVKIIGDYVSLKKRGANYVGLCPFHSEKTPSFAVHPAKQIFKCFGCSEGGDVISFVMRIEHCDFPEAIQILARKTGIPIPAAPPAREEDRRKAADLYAINEWACQFFEESLASRPGESARAYLAERSIKPETATQLRLGYAPDSWDALTSHLRKRGASPEQAAASGLLVAREDRTGSYDRFRGRLIFPILDPGGRVVAFGGRAFRPADPGGREEPKYLNSPESPIYTKGRHLYGLHLSKEAIRQARCAILVEGYLDYLLPFQEGVPNVVASLGTALTDAQAALLKRFAERVVINFDADPAGRSATLRSVEVLMRAGLTVQVLALPDGEDPDSFVRRQGGVEYAKRATEAQNYIDFVLDRSIQGKDLQHPSTRVEAFRTALPFLAIVPDSIERSAFSDHVASRLKLDPQLVQQEVRREVRQPGGPPKPATEGEAGTIASRPPLQMAVAERRLLEVLLAAPELAPLLLAAHASGDLGSSSCADLFQRTAQALADDGALDYGGLTGTIAATPEERDLLERSLMAAVPDAEDARQDEFEACLLGIRRQRIEREIVSLQLGMDEALRAGDLPRHDQLYARKSELKGLLARNGFGPEVVSGTHAKAAISGGGSPAGA